MTKDELAVDFMHTRSSSAQDRLWNSEKHLEEERIEEPIKSKSEKKKSEKHRRTGLSDGPSDQPTTPPSVGLSDPIGPD